MGKLEGKIALIAGDTGGVGKGIVRAFIHQGVHESSRLLGEYQN